MFGPNRDENTPLVWSVVRSHWVKGSVFFFNVLVHISDTFGLIRMGCVPGAFAARQEPQKAGVRWRNANYLDAV